MASGLAFLAAMAFGNVVPSELPVLPFRFHSAMDAIDAVQHQVRVERRVIVRITPFSTRQGTSQMPVPDAQADIRSVDTSSPVRDGCLPLAEVTGVRLAADRRLLLLMRDRRVITASFERSCPVQGFYSGFYVERPKDGLLCAGRERLHARSGAECTLGGFAEPDRDGDAKD